METSVSLLVMTFLKLKPDGPEELVAVLQRRGAFNHETLGPESWPGACQLTVHGKVEPGELNTDALWRETKEELGEGFAKTEDDWEDVIEDVKMIGEVNKPGKTIKHCAILIPPAWLKDIRLNASTDELRLVSQADLANIQNLPATCNKQEGVRDKEALVMFPDEIEALKTAFTAFAGKPGTT